MEIKSLGPCREVTLASRLIFALNMLHVVDSEMLESCEMYDINDLALNYMQELEHLRWYQSTTY